MKNVLLLLHDDPGQEARLQAALDVVRALNGHLMCLDVVGVAVDAGYPGPEATALLVEQEGRREVTNRARLEEHLAKEDVAWTIAQATGSFASCLAEAARLADLIVLNPQLDDDGPDMAGIATSLLLKTGKPVLIVPKESRGFAASGPALVAWDGSLPAMAALTAAVPLLKLASEVRILEVQGTSHGAVEEAARYLSRHGIEPEIDLLACFRDAPHETSAVIQDRAEQMRCAYCVMGAYGHSPIREAILGGVTRRMLRTGRMPVLLAH